jgi:hypothetical protein
MAEFQPSATDFHRLTTENQSSMDKNRQFATEIHRRATEI